MNQQALSAFIWSVADLLRGDFKQSEYGRVILPFTVLRRLDCVLEPTKKAVLAAFAVRKKSGINPEPFLLRKSGQSFCNTSPLDMKKLAGDQDHIRENLYAYIAAFSPAVRDIFDRFDFHAFVERLAKANLLYLVIEKFAQIDLHPNVVDNHQRLPTEQFNDFPLPIPPTGEQVAISSFLDRETAKIDALVAEQEKLIALLKEKRQALISHAVTKGLDPNAPMKDSGVEWLGQVPVHWEILRVASISTKITNGYVGPTRDILRDEGIRYLQSLHIKENRIRFDQPYYVDKEWSEDHAKSVLEAGDVLIVQTGDIGQVAVVPREFSGCNCHALIIVSPVRSKVSGEWLSWVLNSEFGFHSLLSIQTGALHPHLNCGNVKDLSVPIPPADEQARIVRFIESKLLDFDVLISETERSIGLLKERRSALISAAVTGKIDVRG